MQERSTSRTARPVSAEASSAGFAIVALIIACAGLFGVLSQSVSQRSRELAVRTALGASPGAVVGVALKQTAIAMFAGLAIGLTASAALSNNLTPFIYGVSTLDWLSFGVAPLVLIVAGALACIVPARRVARTDPVQVLRQV